MNDLVKLATQFCRMDHINVLFVKSTSMPPITIHILIFINVLDESIMNKVRQQTFQTKASTALPRPRFRPSGHLNEGSVSKGEENSPTQTLFSKFIDEI